MSHQECSESVHEAHRLTPETTPFGAWIGWWIAGVAARSSARPSSQIQGIGLYDVTGLLFNLTKKFGGELDIEITNGPRFAAGEVTVGIGSVSVESTTGPVETFDHTSRLECLKILVDRGMADVAAKVIELFENIARAQMTLLSPQQIEDHAALPAQAQHGDGSHGPACSRLGKGVSL
jgi:hypothetical protein